jgi:hypothetical protein
MAGSVSCGQRERMVQRYRNVSGDSGVVAFDLRPSSVIVQFRDGWKYEYTISSAGPDAVAEMKRLAMQGRGLSTFVSQHVRDAYARRFR